MQTYTQTKSHWYQGTYIRGPHIWGVWGKAHLTLTVRQIYTYTTHCPHSLLYVLAINCKKPAQFAVPVFISYIQALTRAPSKEGLNKPMSAGTLRGVGGGGRTIVGQYRRIKATPPQGGREMHSG